MCGIFGIIAKEIDKAQVKKATNLMEHRGPDDVGFFFDKGIALGHRRLSIIDLSKNGHQPMTNKDETLWIIFNGEIYNFQEIRQKLEKKYDFKSQSDTEVILYAYQEWGERCVEKFNGIFAFAIWDAKKKILFLARDRAGIKPLYYHQDNSQFIFASEIKSILAMGIPKVLNTSILYDYVNYLTLVGQETFFKGVYAFSPGHYGTLKKGKLNLVQYWDISYNSKQTSEAQAASELKESLDTSVKRQMISDVPVGAFLSGGLDSSTIVALASKHAKKLRTFTAGFDVFPEEIEAAEFVSRELGTEQHNVSLNSEMFIKALPNLVYHYDGPLAFASSVPLYYVSKLTKHKATVVLTGEGADELFAGYRRYHLIQKSLKLNNFLTYAPGKSFAFRFAQNSLSDPRYIKILSLALKGINPDYLTGINAIHGKEREEAISIPENKTLNIKVERLFNMQKSDFTNRLLYLDFHTYLQELLMKQDKMSMAASIESRVPFLDNEIIDFASTLPSIWKLKGDTGKYILRKAVKQILPPSIIKRKKVGFAVPLDIWFKKELRGYLQSQLLNKDGAIFKEQYVKKVLEKQKYSNCSLQLWAMLNLSLFKRRFFMNGAS